VSSFLLLPRIAQAQETKAAVDTEHIFGFTEGADIGEKGEKGIAEYSDRQPRRSSRQLPVLSK
jgi:hypothetical protein